MSGRVERVTYASTETGFAVLRVRPKNGAVFTAAGYVPDVVNQIGLEGADLEFSGRWTVTKYGRQFAFSAYRPVGSELLFFFSKVVKGLGAKLAETLMVSYGEEGLIKMLDEAPERLLEVKGIKERRLGIIIRSWRKYKGLRELAEYLSGAKGAITPNLLIRIYNHFEDKAIDVIREDPYRLTEIRGIGFKTADRIALGLGVAPHSPSRMRAAAVHLLVNAAESEGHCYLGEKKLTGLMADVLSYDGQVPEDDMLKGVLSSMILDGVLVAGPDREIGLSQYKHMEDWLLDFFKERSCESDRKVVSCDTVDEFTGRFEETVGIDLSFEQKEIIRRIAVEPRLVFGLAGYAGTGKTTVCRAILDLVAKHFAARDQIVCCAFTGMASARLRKATGYDAFTIHSLLKYQGEGRFEHGPERPLPHRVVVLDEASMVNLPIFFRLARALRPDALLILVGDPAQLSPIGAGNVFSDILEAGLIPAVHLTKIYRQSEDSVLTIFANEIRQGRVPEGVERQGWRDFAFCNVEKYNIFALKKGNKGEAELRSFREKNNNAILGRIEDLARQYKERLTHP
ncbi:MAG: AAA family ATPase, partial [Dissulfurimicrobium sp.]